VARDYQEAITYSFVGADADSQLSGHRSELVIANPISSEMSVMRGTLWSGLLQAASDNLSRQQERVRLFEIGKSFGGTLQAIEETLRVAGLVIGPVYPEQWGRRGKTVDFFDIKRDVETLIASSGAQRDFTFVATEHTALQPGQSAAILRSNQPVGIVGKIHPRLARDMDVRKDVYVFELDASRVFETHVVSARAASKYPALRRDLAILVDDSVPAADIVSAIESSAPAFIGNVVIFDIYRGPGIEAGLKSVALGLILQETSRTLTDEDADSAMAAAVRKLQHEFAAVLRD
jgi:phenylalanyl-tRNA synthetase beta chain